MENLFENELKLLSELEKYSISFGIFGSNENIEETVTIYNLDGTASNIRMKIKDIMYLTENGTINVPARPILNTIYKIISIPLDIVLQNIIDDIFDNKITNSDEIQVRLKSFVNTVNSNYIRQGINRVINENKYLSTILNQEDENKYIFNLNKLEKYIKCKLIIKN